MAEKNCAVCGNPYKGIGSSCKDGSYCDACSKKLRLVCSEDDAEFMSASQIREMLNRYASEIEAYYTVQKPETCPFCGKKLPKLLNLRMLDAYICADCGNRAAEMLHTDMMQSNTSAFRRSHRCSHRLRYRAAKRMHPAGFMMQMRFALCIR